jgi:hypothetical protein
MFILDPIDYTIFIKCEKRNQERYNTCKNFSSSNSRFERDLVRYLKFKMMLISDKKYDEREERNEI